MHDPRGDHDPGIPAESLDPLADRLRAWQPATPVDIDRDRLIFEAGRAAGIAETRRAYRGRFWPLATAASLLMATAGFLLARQQGREQGRRPETVESVAIPSILQPTAELPPIEPVDPNSYLALARRIADGHLDPFQAGSKSPDPDSSRPRNDSAPLRARDVDRLLNL